MCQHRTQQGDLYSITSSARVRSVAGMSRPSALAVLRLTTARSFYLREGVYVTTADFARCGICALGVLFDNSFDSASQGRRRFIHRSAKNKGMG
jgi:hypothetical protein